MEVSSLEIIDIADDLRMADVSGPHGELAVDVVKFKDLLGRLGGGYYAREGKHWWPTRVIPLLGFMVVTNEGVARI